MLPRSNIVVPPNLDPFPIRDSKNTQTGDLLKAYDEYTQVDIETLTDRKILH